MSALTAFEALVALTAVQRGLELLYSRRQQRRQSPASRNADPRGNWSALVVLQGAWLAGSALEPALRGAIARGAALACGLALFAAGAALRVWCMRALGASWNARARVDPTLAVVSTGPYRWLRHPNYLGVLLEAVGLPLAGGAWIVLAAAAPLHALVLARRMRGEDELLARVPGYSEHMAHKGALWPRWTRAPR